MLSEKARKRLPWVILSAILLAIFSDFVWWWVSLGYSFDTAICDPTGSQQDCPRYNILFGFAVSWAYDLNYWGAMVTAIATGFIAWFTFSLRDATKEQGRLTQESIKLARDEFNATKRPKIIIHSAGAVFGLPGNPNTPVGITVRYYNKGVAPAIITMIHCRIFVSPFPLGPNFHIDQRPDLIPSEDIASGESQIFSFISPTTADHLLRGDRIFCIGRIDYIDQGGRRRETGFICEFKDIGRWVRVPDDPNGYDYSY